MQPAETTTTSPLKNFRFLQLLTFRVLIVLSYQIMAVVVGWHIYQITRDPLALGLVGLAEVVPYFCSALFAGYAVDHFSRKMFGVFAAAIVAINAFLLAIISDGMLGGDISHWIYLSVGFIGFARAFIAPTYSTLFAYFLPRTQYAKAASMGSTVFQAGLVTGPAIGGIIVGWASIAAAYAAATVLALLAAAVLFSLKTDAKPVAERSPIFSSIGEGVRFVWNNEIILAAQALDMFAVLFGGAVAMLPVFIQDIYMMGPEALGILRAAPATGAIIIGVILSRYHISRHAGRFLLFAVSGFGLCIIAFAVTTHFWVAAFLLLLSGVCDGVSVVLRTTIMQLMTPDAMRGRVASINGLFIGSSNELGALESGLAARLMGLVPSVIFGGMMTISVVLATTKLAPKLLQLDIKQLH